jgi:magnesium-transporting ATPase (P-type)
MNRILDNKPLIWAVIGGLLVAVIAFIFTPIRNLLGIVPLTLQQWFVVTLIALSLLFTVEVAKFISNRLKISGG